MNRIFGIIILLLVVVGVANGQEVVRRNIDPILAMPVEDVKFVWPPMYDPAGKTDPFETMDQWTAKEQANAELAKPKVDVPITSLTSWNIRQLTLSGFITRSGVRQAFFVSPNDDLIKACVGDFIGPDGLKIASINDRNVVLDNGDIIQN